MLVNFSSPTVFTISGIMLISCVLPKKINIIFNFAVLIKLFRSIIDNTVCIMVQSVARVDKGEEC